MTKRKYKVFVRYTLLMLCLFPLVIILLNSITDGVNIENYDYGAVIDKFVISESFTAELKNVLPSFGFALDGAFADVVPIIMANSIIIYIMYIAIEVLLFIPKFAVELLSMCTLGGKYE